MGIFRFLASGFRFSRKILAVFWFWYPMWFLVFLILSYFGFRFLFDLSNTCCETPKLFRGMRDKINVMVGDQASPLTPGETLTSQTRATIWSVCELWLPTYLPRQQRKKQLWIVLRFFTRRGKAARIFERKTSLDVK